MISRLTLLVVVLSQFVGYRNLQNNLKVFAPYFRGAGVNIFNYRFSLYALRDKYIGHAWATFLPGGIQHTMTQSDALYLNRKFRGVSAGTWLGRINEKTPSDVPAAHFRAKD